ncbi:hypothetical protein [Halorussus litoreus]|uniref:hypothetical protein n=1 Tax=Halorussus litoreus TaxID=1710536 RepID=UPI000E2698E6|nr:hypothetical protein [Halorussus litoreus]
MTATDSGPNSGSDSPSGTPAERLPDPEQVVSRAEEATADGDVNLVVAGAVDPETVERTDDGYVGESAGAVGRLAAAVEACETVAETGGAAADVALHYPEPAFTADGPWLVLAPLGGFASTVTKGTGRAEVTVEYDARSDHTLDGLDERVSALTEALAPHHDHYPVESDDRGTFTTGLTTFALDSLSVDGDLTATFDVSTTPATSPSAVEARLADVADSADLDARDASDGVAGVASVESVDFETVTGVERAAPSANFREAVEAAHREVRGDCEYEWLPQPGVFAEIPGAEKLALGTGTPGAQEFSAEQHRTCVDLLASTLSRLEVVA